MCCMMMMMMMTLQSDSKKENTPIRKIKPPQDQAVQKCFFPFRMV